MGVEEKAPKQGQAQCMAAEALAGGGQLVLGAGALKLTQQPDGARAGQLMQVPLVAECRRALQS